jgi:hypothetical protein
MLTMPFGSKKRFIVVVMAYRCNIMSFLNSALCRHVHIALDDPENSCVEHHV